MVRRKDGRWQEQVGKKYFYGKTKSEVLRKIADWTEQEEKGRTFAEVLDEWDAKRSADCEAGKLAYNSYAANKATVAKLREQFGDRRIREVAPQQLQAYLSSMTQARRTVQMYLDVLRMVFRYYVLKPLKTYSNIKKFCQISVTAMVVFNVPTAISRCPVHPARRVGLLWPVHPR